MTGKTLVTTSYSRFICGICAVVAGILVMVYGSRFAADDSSIPYTMISLIIIIIALLTVVSSREKVDTSHIGADDT